MATTTETQSPFPELSFDDCFEQVLVEQIPYLTDLDDRNIDRLREEVADLRCNLQLLESYTDLRINELRADLDRAELEIIELKYSQPSPPQPSDRPYRKTKPVAAVGGIGFLLLCFSAASFAVAGFSSSPSQKDYHAGLAGMLACAGLGTIAGAVATSWDD